MNIHPTAIISSDATLADGVAVGPYSIIGPDVHIGKNTKIGPHVVIETHTDIGEENRIAQFASIGGAPQDLKFQGEATRVVIGSHNTIREYVTINRSTVHDIGVTMIGDHNLLMAYCHVAHNCKLGNQSCGQCGEPAGHIHVEDHDHRRLTGVHQFTRIKPIASSAAPRRTKDIPPLASGNFAKLSV
jgi:UDP-N-acetylglucosamine acyltransferase